MDPLKAGLAHEQYVTSLIHAIYEAAYEAKDFRTMQFLDWFVKEQGEEETNATDLIKKMELFGSDPKGLYMLDQELAARTYAAPLPDSVRVPLWRFTHGGPSAVRVFIPLWTEVPARGILGTAYIQGGA